MSGIFDGDDEFSAEEPAESPGGFGPIDAGSLRDIREVFAQEEQLVESATLAPPLDPHVLRIELADGIGPAESARFDVRWSLTDNYAFHYRDEEGVDFRFDRHPKPDAPTIHFHTPPDAPRKPVEASCIRVTESSLVARAVLKLWRGAYEHGSFDGLNEAEDPS